MIKSRPPRQEEDAPSKRKLRKRAKRDIRREPRPRAETAERSSGSPPDPTPSSPRQLSSDDGFRFADVATPFGSGNAARTRRVPALAHFQRRNLKLSNRDRVRLFRFLGPFDPRHFGPWGPRRPNLTYILLRSTVGSTWYKFHNKI